MSSTLSRSQRALRWLFSSARRFSFARRKTTSAQQSAKPDSVVSPSPLDAAAGAATSSGRSGVWRRQQ
jgi:hypothetical protein